MLKEIRNDGGRSWVKSECGHGEAIPYLAHHSKGSNESEPLMFVTEQMLVPGHCLKESKPLGPLLFFSLVTKRLYMGMSTT